MEIYIIAITGALIALCLFSHIFVSIFGGSGAKVTFCFISALCLVLAVVLELVCLGVILIAELEPLVGNVALQALLLALAVVSSAELAAFSAKRDKNLKAEKAKAKNNGFAVEPDLGIMPNNTRKKGERIHGEYTVINN